uniref:Uncharacterized protein n=2 Tax=Tetranychus urticae TaxID=32264 RepID=T1KNS6_TETUR
MPNISVIDNHIFNIESHYIRRRPSLRVVNDIFMQFINDGDSFFICPLLGLIDPEFPFDLCIVLVASERAGIQPTECTPSYCKILNTRALLNRKKAIIFNSELLSKVKAAFTEERFQGQNQWLNILLYFNILQHFNTCCRYNRMRQKRLYLPNRG